MKSLRPAFEALLIVFGLGFMVWLVSFLAGAEVWPRLPKDKVYHCASMNDVDCVEVRPTRHVVLPPLYLEVDCTGEVK